MSTRSFLTYLRLHNNSGGTTFVFMLAQRISHRGWRAMKGIIAYLELKSRWAELRALGNSGIVKSSVLMPLFGYMLLLNERVHVYLSIPLDGALLNYLPPM